MAVLWIAVAAGLVLFELHHLAFYSLFGAAGSAAAAVAALVAPDGYAVQVLALFVVTALGIWLVRPYVS